MSSDNKSTIMLISWLSALRKHQSNILNSVNYDYEKKKNTKHFTRGSIEATVHKSPAVNIPKQL